LTARLGRVLELYQSEAVHRLVNEKKVEEAKKIIEKNPAYLTVADSQGYNVLHYAAKHDLYEFIRFILTFAKPLSALKGEPIVNINTRDASRWTPLHWGSLVLFQLKP
jgi:ankyrin repeat protein